MGRQAVTIELGVVACICNFSTWRMRQEDGEFESSVGHRVRVSETKENKNSNYWSLKLLKLAWHLSSENS